MSQYDEPLDSVIVAALADALTPVEPPPALRARILERVHSQRSGSGIVTIRSGSTGWCALIPGIYFKMLTYDEAVGTKSFLLRAEAGMRMPAHGHHGYEECLVIEGEFCFGELSLRAGDFHGASADVLHCEAYTQTGVTVYLRSSIQDYPGIGP